MNCIVTPVCSKQCRRTMNNILTRCFFFSFQPTSALRQKRAPVSIQLRVIHYISTLNLKTPKE